MAKFGKWKKTIVLLINEICCLSYFFLISVTLNCLKFGRDPRKQTGKKSKLINSIWAGKYK